MQTNENYKYIPTYFLGDNPYQLNIASAEWKNSNQVFFLLLLIIRNAHIFKMVNGNIFLIFIAIDENPALHCERKLLLFILISSPSLPTTV